MPSAIELGFQFGIAPDKVIALAAHLGVDLDAPAFVPDAGFNRVAADLRRGNLTAFTVAYWLDAMLNGGEAGEQRADALVALTPDKGAALAQAFTALDHATVNADKLAGAKLWLDKASALKSDPGALDKLATWAKGALSHARGDVSHLFLSVRLMLSLPENERANYNKAIQGALNYMKHYGYLDGWHRVDADAKGKRKTVYFNGGNHLDL